MKHLPPSVPEPRGPEHQLIVDAATMPTLSDGLRDRVMADCRHQARLGRNADRMRIIAAVVAASLFVALVWNFRWTDETTARFDSAGQDTMVPSTSSPAYESPGKTNLVAPDEAPKLPQGGPGKESDDIREMQQINRLIDDLNQRQNILCGIVPYLR